MKNELFYIKKWTQECLKQGSKRDFLVWHYLEKRMMYELVNTSPSETENPYISEIFDEYARRSSPNDYSVYLVRNQITVDSPMKETLHIDFEPQFSILMMTTNKGLEIYFCGRMHRIKFRSPSTIADWIVRQKENYDSYIMEFEEIAESVGKQAKTDRLAQLAIKAIFNDAMKQYPHIKYNFQEQSKRMRITIVLHDGQETIIYSYYATYRQRLHGQINNLKKSLQNY